ncbi:TPA: hypothetical protein SIA26_001395 [Aeromonas bestiarum]|nr:hypothetical protein [Aeromonas bestiarum]
MINYKRGDTVIRKSDNQVMTVVTKDGHKAWCAIEANDHLSYGVYDEDELTICFDSKESISTDPF